MRRLGASSSRSCRKRARLPDGAFLNLQCLPEAWSSNRYHDTDREPIAEILRPAQGTLRMTILAGSSGIIAPRQRPRRRGFHISAWEAD